MKRVGILAAVFAASSAMAADGTTTGGYVDAQYMWGKTPSVNSFAVKEGSVWLKGNSGNTMGVVEIPFTYNPPTTVAGTEVDQTGFVVGMARAQGYVEMKYDSGFSWKLGQFHSMYGSEGKRTLDLPFTSHSMITEQFMPWTHAGWAGSYWLNTEWYVTLLIANPTNNATMSHGNPDFGAKVGGKFANMGIEEISAAFLMGRVGDAKPWMISGILDLAFGPLHLRGDGLLRKQSSSADMEIGVGGYAAYELSDMFAYSLRFGFATNQAPTDKKFQLSTGPEFKMSKALTAKVDYTLNKYALSGADMGHEVTVSGVYAF